VASRDATFTPALAKIARGPDAKSAVLAVAGLAALRGSNAACELAVLTFDRATTEPAWIAAATAIRALGVPGLAALAEAIERASADRRARLVELSASSFSDDELAMLVAMLADPRAPRASVARELLIAAGDRASDVAFERLDDAPARVRTAIVDFLASRAEANLSGRLAERARSGALPERLSAIELLGELGEEDALGALAPLLEDPLAEIRARTAQVIAVVPDADVRAQLFDHVRRDEPVVRVGALRGLARVRPRDASLVRVGLHATHDVDEDVRLAALELLAAPSDPAIVRALRRRAIEAQPTERVAIAKALAESRLPEAIVLLVDLATDIDPAVKAAAVAALGGRSSTPTDR
ncbi:HEAT repeat domain-containing protein, partial [Myxococcota bacterium]|nr:HEAT repeat domain-containing protein [Myxococcota bacterium]